MDHSFTQNPQPTYQLTSNSRPTHPTSAMSLKNGIYQLRFVPAGGEPAPGELAATGEGLGNTVPPISRSNP